MTTCSRFMMAIAILTVFTACAAGPGTGSVGSEQPRYVNVRVVDGPVAVNRSDDEADPNEILCKRVRKPGSHFHRQVCATRVEWEAERRKAERMMREHSQRNAATWTDW